MKIINTFHLYSTFDKIYHLLREIRFDTKFSLQYSCVYAACVCVRARMCAVKKYLKVSVTIVYSRIVSNNRDECAKLRHRDIAAINYTHGTHTVSELRYRNYYPKAATE